MNRRRFLTTSAGAVLLAKFPWAGSSRAHAEEQAVGTSPAPSPFHPYKSLSITKVEIFKFDLPLKETFFTAIDEETVSNNILVKVYTDGGLTGVGEVAPALAITGDTQEGDIDLMCKIARLIKGKDPLAIEERLWEIDEQVPHARPAMSGFDLAFYDLLAKRAGLPLAVLLGGQVDQPIPTDMTLSLDRPEVMARKASEYVKMGFTAIKAKVGTGIADDVARIKSIRAAVGDKILLRLDANQGWNDVATAVRALEALSPFKAQFCEEPIRSGDAQALAQVRAKSPIPIMADESVFDQQDALRLAQAKACDYFNIKLSKCGGISGALKIAAVAEAAAIPCQVGCMSESRLGLTALAHVMAARKIIAFADLDSSFDHKDDPVIGGIQFAHGSWTLPRMPGLGAEVMPAFLEKAKKISI